MKRRDFIAALGGAAAIVGCNEVFAQKTIRLLKRLIGECGLRDGSRVPMRGSTIVGAGAILSLAQL